MIFTLGLFTEHVFNFYRFGPPLVLREDRTVSWDQLQQNILAKTHYLMRSDAHLPVSTISNG